MFSIQARNRRGFFFQERPAPEEEVSFSFDPEGRLYAMDLEFSLGMGAVISNDKFRYTPGIIKEYTTLEKKYLALFGEEDERINAEAAVPLSYWKTGYVWNSVPFGNPPADSDVRISLTSFNISQDHAVPTRTVSARYTRNDVSPPAIGNRETLFLSFSWPSKEFRVSLYR